MTTTHMTTNPPMRRVRSFVRRDSRITEGQYRAIEELAPRFCLSLSQGHLNFYDIFKREAPRIIEIGFGGGKSLLATAIAHSEEDFIGIEMHQPGIGSLLLGIEETGISNLRIFYADAVEVMKQAIPDQSLDGVQLFFPDPWPKRKHHKRRIIQPEFVQLICSKLKTHGVLHLATDWQHYAEHMMRVLSETVALENKAGKDHYANRSDQRPVVTKFEQRGTQSGRKIWELQFVKL